MNKNNLFIVLIIFFCLYIIYNLNNIGVENFVDKHKKQIEHIDFEKISNIEFETYIKSSKPIIFYNVLKNKITLKDFCDKLKDKEINIRKGDYGSTDGRKDRKFYKETIEKYCINLLNNGKHYGGNNKIYSHELCKINIKPNNKNYNSFNSGKLWIGGPNSRTPLHKDAPENLALQLYGKKKWVLFDSKDVKNLCYNNNNKKLEWSNYSLGDYTTCPKAINAKPYKVILKQGEMLYLPKQWSHDVTNLSNSIMINFWYKNSNILPIK